MKTIKVKVVILGTQGVGKTSLVTRYDNNVFYQNTSSTIGASFSNIITESRGYKIKMQVWDTAGQERFRSMVPVYYRGANAAILVFDITNYASFTDVQAWVQELESVVGLDDFALVIAGNKCDLDDKRTVPYNTALKYAHSIDAAYFETSALTKTGVEATFMHLGSELARREEDRKINSHLDSTMSTSDDDSIHQLDTSKTIAKTSWFYKC